jgi:hypothetical protein
VFSLAAPRPCSAVSDFTLSQHPGSLSKRPLRTLLFAAFIWYSVIVYYSIKSFVVKEDRGRFIVFLTEDNEPSPIFPLSSNVVLHIIRVVLQEIIESAACVWLNVKVMGKFTTTDYERRSYGIFQHPL